MRRSLALLSVMVVGGLGAVPVGLGACGGGDNNGTPPVDAGKDTTTSDAPHDTGPQPDANDSGPQACTAPGTTLVAQFALPASGAPDVLDVPFPSDVYRDATSGKLAATYNKVERIIPSQGSNVFGQFGQVSAFGASSGAIFAVVNDTAIDPATVPGEGQCGKAGSAAFLVDLDATSAQTALLPCVATYYDERSRGVPAEPAIVVRPARGSVVPSGHHVAAVITSGIKDTSGNPLQPSTTFAGIRDGARTGAAQTLYGNALDKAVSFGVPKCSVAALTTWTTFDYDGEMSAARAALNATTAPTLSWAATDLAPMGLALFAQTVPAGATEYVATLDQYLGVVGANHGGTPSTFYGGAIDNPGKDQPAIAHDNIGALGTAVFQSPNFMVGDEASISTTDPKYNNFYYASGKPAINPAKKTNPVWVTIALPKTAPPANGYPVVIWQHGFGQERSDMYGAMNVFAKEGWATVAINLVAHGPRSYKNAPPTALRHADTQSFRSDFPANGQPWGTYTGPDGMADADGGGTDLVASFLAYVTVRDQLRQSALDISSLVRALQANPDLGPMTKAVSGAKLDGTQIVYLGVSFGSIIGTVFLGEEPGIKHAILNVNGAQLATQIANHSPIIMSQARTIFATAYGLTAGTFLQEDQPEMNVIQHLLDPGDPIVMAQHIMTNPLSIGGTPNAKKNILSMMVQWDEWVPNNSAAVAAKAIGLSIAKPHLTLDPALPEVDGTSGTVTGTAGTPFGVLIEQSPATHASNLSSIHDVRVYAAGFPDYKNASDVQGLFPKLQAACDAGMCDTPTPVLNPIYNSLTSATSFFKSALAGGAISVSGITAPTNIPAGQ